MFLLYNSLCSITDIDECLEHVHNCSNETEICVNTIGSFECQCVTGYMKENGVCTGMYKLI